MASWSATGYSSGTASWSGIKARANRQQPEFRQSDKLFPKTKKALRRREAFFIVLSPPATGELEHATKNTIQLGDPEGGCDCKVDNTVRK